jgi:hypothetical protein
MVRTLVESEWPDANKKHAFFDSLVRYMNPAFNVRGTYQEILTGPE